MDPFEVTGYWYVPGQTEAGNAGTLRLAADGAYLDLYGDLGARHPSEMLSSFTTEQRVVEYPLVLGTLLDGQRITLLHCREVGANASLFDKRVARTNWLVRYILRGTHLAKPAGLRVRAAQTTYQNLAGWMPRRKFDVVPTMARRSATTGGRRFTAWKAVYQPPPRKLFRVRQGSIAFEESFTAKGSESSDGDASYTMRGFPIVTIRPRRPVSYERFESDLGRPVRELLSLIFRRPAHLQEVFVQLPDGSQAYHELLYSAVRPPQHGTSRELRTEDALLSPADLFSLGSSPWQAWLDEYQELRTVLWLYHAARSGAWTYSEQKFQLLISCLEGLHRAWHPATTEEEEAHRARVASILASAPAEHVDWLRQRIDFPSSAGLRKRLSTVVRAYTGSLRPLIKGNEYQYLSRLVRNRDYLAHGLQIEADERMSGTELYWASELLFYAIELLVLTRIGVPESLLEARLKSNPYYRFAVDTVQAES